MIQILSKNQNWAKVSPIFGIISLVALFVLYNPNDILFWALINIPLYFFHQTEEHLWPGGFKNYINRVVNNLPEGEETLTDEKVFWINIIFVWVAFTIFGSLSFYSIGFGLLIIIFSIINCLSHIVQAIKRKEWNPGLVIAILQFILSLYAAYFVTVNGLTHQIAWWVGNIAFSIVCHIVLFKVVMIKK